jgi:hypothetical protein
MSDKTVAQKLLIKEGFSVAFVNAPKNYRVTLGALPKNVKLLAKPDQSADVIKVFVANRKELEEQLSKLKPLLSPQTILWVSYLKGTAKTKTDINRDSIHAYAKSVGLEGVSLVSVDDDWSAMRFKLL